MGQEAGASGADVTRAPEEIREDIEGTRRQLGSTIEALAAKTDLKGRAKAGIDRGRQRIGEVAGRLRGRVREATPDDASDAASQASEVARSNPDVVAAVAIFLIGVAAGFWLARD